ncbi:MAG: hypothetical protein OHK0017_05170 [Patescibacteria group bacterium]
MQKKYFKNAQIAKKYSVSRPTVSNWVEAAKRGENNLQLEIINDRLYIIDNLHNEAELFRLKDNSTKYRNKLSFEKLEIDPRIYDIFSDSQLIELVSSLDREKTIPLKFSYFNGGSKAWDNYIKTIVNQSHYYVDGLAQLLSTSLDYISFRLKQSSFTNIIDIGPGNGITLKPLLDKLKADKVSFNYTAIDLSQQMLDVLKDNYAELYPDINVSTVLADVEQIMIRDTLLIIA